VNHPHFTTGSQKHRDPRFPPFAVTEHGAIMAADGGRGGRRSYALGSVTPFCPWYLPPRSL
jgi:hypothetical protein